MTRIDERPHQPFQLSLSHIVYVVSLLCVYCAVIPGAAMFILGSTPVALGFIVFVIGDQRGREWITVLGAALMAVGLGIGAVLMTIVDSLG